MDFLDIDTSRTDAAYADWWWSRWLDAEDEYATLGIPMPAVPANAPRWVPTPVVEESVVEAVETVVEEPVVKAVIEAAPARPSMDEAQLRVVEHRAGPALVMAGAGSGKTRTITARVARLTRSEDARGILCLTFTRRAATEMRARIAKEVGSDTAKRIAISTFHSLALDLVRTYPVLSGRQPGFSVWDDDVQKNEVKAIVRQHELGRGVKNGEWVSPREICAALDTVKEQGHAIPSKAFHKLLGEVHEQAWEVAVAYEELKVACNALDFADLVWTAALRLLDPGAACCRAVQDRWRWVIVDEYQDTNAIQEILLKRLVEGHGNLMVVGDEDQCQPTESTHVRLEDGREILIGDIKPGDRVKSFDKAGGLVVTGTVTEVKSRCFRGPMYRVEAGGKSSYCTPEHRWIVRWRWKPGDGWPPGRAWNTTWNPGDVEELAADTLANLIEYAEIHGWKLEIPTLDGWEALSITKFHYDGNVTSLDVAPHHTYVADGLVTCNSIYGFRGSNVDYIRSFGKRHPGAITYLLGRNYRSTPEIVGPANALISQNRHRNYKRVWSEAASGEPTTVTSWSTPNEEARAIAGEIGDQRTAGATDTEIAVLVRTRMQFLPIQFELQKLAIPFYVVGDAPWYTRVDAKTLLAWFRGTVNERDLGTGADILKSWDGLGSGTVSLWKEGIQSISAPMFARLGFLHDKPGLGLHTKRGKRLAAFGEAWDAWSRDTLHPRGEKSLRARAEELLALLGITQEIAEAELSGRPDEADEARRRKNFLAQLLESMPGEPGTGRHDGVTKWLDDLFTSIQNDQSKDGVCLTTVHGSKGLEWDYTWLPGWSSGVFPSDRANSAVAVEEERRLAYVALTRAKKRARVSWYRSSSIPEPRSHGQSLFIGEMLSAERDASWTTPDEAVVPPLPPAVPARRTDTPTWASPAWFVGTYGECKTTTPDDDQPEHPWYGWNETLVHVELRAVTLHDADEPSRCLACARAIRVGVALSVQAEGDASPSSIRLGRKCAARLLGQRGKIFDATAAEGAVRSAQEIKKNLIHW